MNWPEASFTKATGDLFSSPLDFLAGKSCSSVCGSTWDFHCYVENFCVANLLKMVMVLALLYIVLLFFWLLYKLCICQCVGRSLCKMARACLVSWFSLWEHCCIFVCDKLAKHKRTRLCRRRDFTDSGASEEVYEMSGSLYQRIRDYRGDHLRKSLRPRSHRIRLGWARDSGYSLERNPIRHGNHVHSIRVTHTSKFVRKGTNCKRMVYQNGRR